MCEDCFKKNLEHLKDSAAGYRDLEFVLPGSSCGFMSTLEGHVHLLIYFLLTIEL